MLKNDIVSRNAQVPWQMIEEKTVLVSPKNMKIHILHGTGGIIWDHLKSPCRVDELVSLIVAEYDVAKDEAEDDINVFLKTMVKENLVSCKN